MIVIYFSISLLSSVLTFSFAKKFNCSPTRSSAFVSLLAVGVFYLLSKYFKIDFHFFSLLFFGASFVGMSSYKTNRVSLVVLASFVFTLFFLFINPMLEGYGGALGFTAFLSVLLSNVVFHYTE